MKISKTFGDKSFTIGGGGSGAAVTPNSNLYYLVGGNTLTYLGVPGVKHVTNTVTTGGISGGWSNGVPSTLPDGIGWARSLDTNVMVLVVNDSTSYISYDISAQVVYALKTGTIGTSGASSYDKYTICGAN